MDNRDNYILEMIKKEWNMFQKVNNEGGRASCQDNWREFEMNRRSQFMTWPDEILESYNNDLDEAEMFDRNLIFNKYAYMMEITAPEQYEQRLKAVLPIISPERRARMEGTAAIAAKWAEDYAKMYPEMAMRGRVIHQKDAYPGETSLETYQYGELSSYGEKTEKLYSEFVRKCEAEGRNLALETRTHLLHLHGYE